MHTSISIANMCQPAIVYVCDWKPLDNALHASSFLHLVFDIHLYICEDEKTSLLELRENECNEICWDRTCCWPDSVYTHFFLFFFLSNANRVSLSLPLSLALLSPFFLSWLVTAFPCRRLFRRSNYRNGPTSLLSPLFFFSRVHRELCLFSSRLLLFLFLRFFILGSPMHAPIHPFRVFFLFAVYSFLDVTHLAQKNSSERKCGGWTPQANPWIDKQSSHTQEEKKRKKRRRRGKNRRKENSFFFHVYVRWAVRCLSLEQSRR